MNYISPHTGRAAASTSCHVQLRGDGRLVIPADYRKALGLKAGDTLVIRLEEDEIRVYSLDCAVKRAQAMVAKYDKNKGKSAVDELIAERRREAKRELE